MICPGYLLAAG